ncbi:MAG: hypothetical protein KIT84_01955 [Labilithrix sp.]|nr:hypothetical protein [Labilithrix sp.]MCW5809752.1 hypothetical protein [Labilithrix sp.]
MSFVTLLLAGCNERPKMTVEPNPVVADTTVWARFDRPINGRAVDQYWIVIAPVGAPTEYRSDYRSVPRSAEGMQLQAPSQPGDYEVRLHGDWPKRDHNLVRTVPLRVIPTTEIVGAR